MNGAAILPVVLGVPKNAMMVVEWLRAEGLRQLER